MTKLTIDGKEVEVAAGTLLIQACEKIGIEIPRSATLKRSHYLKVRDRASYEFAAASAARPFARCVPANWDVLLRCRPGSLTPARSRARSSSSGSSSRAKTSPASSIVLT